MFWILPNCHVPISNTKQCVINFFLKLAESENQLGALQFVYEYMATAIITVSYIIVPIIFNLLVRLEQYRPTVVINITMIRYLT